jgi:hypothetical protein
VCSHENMDAPRLLKITRVTVAEGSDLYWIGSPTAANNLAHQPTQPVKTDLSLDYISNLEIELGRKIDTYLQTNTDPEVGGLYINCLSSPLGHCYQNYAGARVDRRQIPDPLEPHLRQQMDNAGMDGFYTYQVRGHSRRGIAAVGVYFQQGSVGYVHLPLLEDDPRKVTNLSMQDFIATLEACA